MPVSAKSLGVDKLPVEDRLALAEELWESVVADGGPFLLSEAQRVEIDRRIAEHEAAPDDVVPWNEVRKKALDALDRS